MPPPPSAAVQSGPRAGTLFAWVAMVFGLIFAGFVAWLEVDQAALLATTAKLQTQALPYAIEQQRLARNLEVLRLEGERVISGNTPQARQQALFIVSLMASHPSLLEHREARALAAETESFLAAVARHGGADATALAEWKRLSQRLSLAADDITIDGVSLASSEAQRMGEIVQQARHKLRAVLVLVLLFLGGLLLLIRKLLIRPLQRIDASLAELKDEAAPLHLPGSTLHEMQAVETAIGQLRTVMHEHAQTRRALEQLAATDALTGLHNRRHFMQLAEIEFNRARRHGRPVSVALADLDHFKQINDRYGHAGGDTALRAFAELARETLRHADIASRYGGEEFAFVFPETTPQEAQLLAERLRHRLSEQRVALADGRRLHFTLSIGIADGAGLSLEEALSRADDTLYRAKAAGRNRVLLASAPAGCVLPFRHDD
ncbi:MAG: GGDEF domain-containing protein [Rhodocyclales bacterium]|nr:GGDEF domain-containing protein [Rhodocyclales bacterium]